MLFLLVFELLFAAPSFAQTAESYRREAVEFSRAKSWDEAIATYRKALDLEPDDALTHYNLALALKYKGDARQAAEEFEAVLRLKPKWADAHYGLGATSYDLLDLVTAQNELRTSVELDPKNAAARRLLARVYAEQSDLSAAEGELQRALALKPSADVHFELGTVEDQLGKLDAAADQFRDALRLNPRLAQVQVLLGVTLRRKGDHATALAHFRKAVEIDPKDPEAQLNLGKELIAGGDTTGAIAAFRRAIQLKPDFEVAHYNLGIALRKQGDVAGAHKELDELNALHEFRARLAQAKLLILQGVEALKKQELDAARHCFKSPSSKVLTCQLAITTWALPGSVRENLHVLLRTTRRRSNSSPTMRRSTRAWGCTIGGRAITLVGSRSSAKRSCPIRTWRRRITTSASRWRNQRD